VAEEVLDVLEAGALLEGDERIGSAAEEVQRPSREACGLEGLREALPGGLTMARCHLAGPRCLRVDSLNRRVQAQRPPR
jgi:hypothetical protein